MELGGGGGDFGEGGAEEEQLFFADLVALVLADAFPVELDLEVVEYLFAVHLEVVDVLLGELAVAGGF